MYKYGLTFCRKKSVVVETSMSFPMHKLCQPTDKTLLKLTKDISQLSSKRRDKAIHINFLVLPRTYQMLAAESS